MEILATLYDSEINFKIETFWDSGFEAWLGDDMNGYRANRTFRTIDEAVAFLRDEAIKHFPGSQFAKRFG